MSFVYKKGCAVLSFHNRFQRRPFFAGMENDDCLDDFGFLLAEFEREKRQQEQEQQHLGLDDFGFLLAEFEREKRQQRQQQHLGMYVCTGY